MRWRTKAGDEIAARLGEPMTKDAISQAWRTALDPRGEWMPSVLRAADQRLTEVRKAIPDAGGLVIATDQDSARAYAKLIREITGTKATVVLSDDTGASKRIDEFSDSDDRWMVAVRMVSEGVDVPRLAVGVYATTISTPLFFAQAVGPFRAVPAARRDRVRLPADRARPAAPSPTRWRSSATTCSTSRRRRARRTRTPSPRRRWTRRTRSRTRTPASRSSSAFEALESEAVFDRVMYDGAEFGMQAHPGSEEEQDYLGIPGLLEPDQVQMLLQKRQARQIAHSRKKPDAEADLLELPAERRPVVSHKEMLELRKQLNTHGRRVRPPERQAARRDPHRAAAGVRRPAQRGGDGGTAAAADRQGAGVGHPDAVTLRRRSPDGLRRSPDPARPPGAACLGAGAAAADSRSPRPGACAGDRAPYVSG